MRSLVCLVLACATFNLAACQSMQDSYSGPTAEHQQLLTTVQQAGMDVLQQGNRICIIIPAIDFFNPQKPELLEGKEQPLLAMAAFVATYKNSPIRVIGFSDNIGSSQNQYYRSQTEAEIVAAYLWRGGVALSQTSTQVLGSSTIGMIASNATPTGRSANERVEVWIN